MASQSTESVTRMTESSPLKKVLVCVDGSEEARLAFQFYRGHLHQSSYEAVIFHVSEQVKIPAIAPGGGIGYMPEAMKAALDEIARANGKLKQEYQTLCHEYGVEHTILIYSDSGDPGAAIVEAAQTHAAQLIVLGCRGLGKIRRTILGSVSDYVIHHSHIPVLVCPTCKRQSVC